MKKQLAKALIASLLFSGLAAANAARLVSQNLGADAYSASASAPYNPPALAFDGDFTTYWNSGGQPPAWLEVNLGRPIEITEIQLMLGLAPSPGSTLQEIWVSNTSIQENTASATLAHTFSGEHFRGQVLSEIFSIPITAQFVQIKSVQAYSYASWYEVQIFGPDSNPIPEPSTAWLLGLGVAAIGGLRRNNSRRQSTRDATAAQ